MKNKKIIYYSNELEDEFAGDNISPITIDENYIYNHNNPLWNICSYLLQNILSMPIKYLYAKIKFSIRFYGKEKLKECKKRGYFIYANHTQVFADTFIPSLANYPKRNYFIVNPENVSMKGLKTLVTMLGAVPIPGNIKASKNFLLIIQKIIKRNNSITIYPEAHIWPYYTKVRPFKNVSFKYPVALNTPIYVLTNTYHNKKGKVVIRSYIDGPFLPNPNLNKKDAQEELRNIVYNKMCERSNLSTYEKIEYIYREEK